MPMNELWDTTGAAAAPPQQSAQDPRIQAFLSQIGAPQPMEVPNKPNMGQLITALLTTIISGNIGAKGHAPLPQNNPMIDSLMQLQKRRQDAKDYNQRQAGASKRSAAEAELGITLDDLKAERSAGRDTAEASARRQERESELAFKKDALAQEKALAEGRNAVTERIANLEASTQKQVAGLRSDTQLMRDEARAGREAAVSQEDKGLKRQVESEQRQGVKQAKTYMMGLNDQFEAELKAGKTPDQLRKRMLRAIDIIGLDEDRQKQVLDYWQQEYEPILKEFEKAKPKAEATPAAKVLGGVAKYGMADVLGGPVGGTAYAGNELLKALRGE